MDKLQFSLVSPAREVFSGAVDHVIAPGTDGDFGVLPRHAPFMSTLKNGVVRVLEGEAVSMRVFVRGGFADVTPEGLTILAEEAVNLADVDPGEVSNNLQAARETALAQPENVIAAEQVAYLEALQSAVAN
jgi:F-type H+-transporting ATPase subunit epsilon